MGRAAGHKGKLPQRLLNKLLNGLLNSLSPRLRLSLQYRRHHGTLPNLTNPRTFSEKLQHRKLHDRDPRLTPYADKVAAKPIVAAIIGEEWIIPTLWHGPKLPPLGERDWPTPYIVKVNNGSGGAVVVRDAGAVDWPWVEAEMNARLGRKYRPHFCETHYHGIAPQILVEPYIGDPAEIPIEYKFFVFGGRVAYVAAHVEQKTDTRIQMFERDWTPAPFAYYRPPPATLPERPLTLARMIEAAERLGAGFSFVRVDFYEIDGQPLFGEMTFMPGSGFRRFDPPEYNRRFGDLWPAAAPGH